MDLSLVTSCIRKDATPNRVFSRNENSVREHYIQLDVVIAAHHKAFFPHRFGYSVIVFLALREHFNKKENVFWASDHANKMKRTVTRTYLQDKLIAIIPGIPERSPACAAYINGAAQTSATSLSFLRNHFVSLGPIVERSRNDVDFRHWVRSQEIQNAIQGLIADLEQYWSWLNSWANVQ